MGTNLVFISRPFSDWRRVADRLHGPASVAIPGTACRAPADGTTDRPYARTNRRTAPGISSDRSEQCSSGCTPGGPAQRPRRHRLARRQPVITWGRIILRILRSRGGRNYSKNPSCRATGDHKTNHFNTGSFSQGRTMLRRRRVTGNGRRADDLCYRSLSGSPSLAGASGPMLAFPTDAASKQGEEE